MAPLLDLYFYVEYKHVELRKDEDKIVIARKWQNWWDLDQKWQFQVRRWVIVKVSKHLLNSSYESQHLCLKLAKTVFKHTCAHLHTYTSTNDELWWIHLFTWSTYLIVYTYMRSSCYLFSIYSPCLLHSTKTGLKHSIRISQDMKLRHIVQHWRGPGT